MVNDMRMTATFLWDLLCNLLDANTRQRNRRKALRNTIDALTMCEEKVKHGSQASTQIEDTDDFDGADLDNLDDMDIDDLEVDAARITKKQHNYMCHFDNLTRVVSLQFPSFT